MNPPPFPGSTCSDCLPGQTCELRKRACFTDNGIIGGTVTASGSVETLCDGVSRVTAAALYCVPPGRLANGTFGTGYVDAVLGLPGLARSESAERMVLQP